MAKIFHEEPNKDFTLSKAYSVSQLLYQNSTKAATDNRMGSTAFQQISSTDSEFSMSYTFLVSWDVLDFLLFKCKKTQAPWACKNGWHQSWPEDCSSVTFVLRYDDNITLTRAISPGACVSLCFIYILGDTKMTFRRSNYRITVRLNLYSEIMWKLHATELSRALNISVGMPFILHPHILNINTFSPSSNHDLFSVTMVLSASVTYMKLYST